MCLACTWGQTRIEKYRVHTWLHPVSFLGGLTTVPNRIDGCEQWNHCTCTVLSVVRHLGPWDPLQDGTLGSTARRRRRFFHLAGWCPCPTCLNRGGGGKCFDLRGRWWNGGEEGGVVWREVRLYSTQAFHPGLSQVSKRVLAFPPTQTCHLSSLADHLPNLPREPFEYRLTDCQ